MKKEIVVKWCPTNGACVPDRQMPGAQILFEEPQSLLKEVGKEYSNSLFWRCPAVIAMCVNTYVVRAPMDMTLMLQKHEDGVFSLKAPGIAHPVLENFFTVRTDGTVSMPPKYVMYSDEPLTVELFPVPILKAPLENMAFIAGEFDIGQWIRPLEFAVMPLDYDKPIEIKRGDALFCIRFLTGKDEVVKLERVEFTQDLSHIVNVCTGVKNMVPRLSLEKLYEMAKPSLDLFKKKQK